MNQWHLTEIELSNHLERKDGRGPRIWRLKRQRMENVLHAMLPKHIRVRKFKESAWFLPWSFLPCRLLLLICMVLNFAAPFVTVRLAEQFQGILFLQMMNYSTQGIEASSGMLAAMMMGNRWLHMRNRPFLGTPPRRVAS